MACRILKTHFVQWCKFSSYLLIYLTVYCHEIAAGKQSLNSLIWLSSMEMLSGPAFATRTSCSSSRHSCSSLPEGRWSFVPLIHTQTMNNTQWIIHYTKIAVFNISMKFLCSPPVEGDRVNTPQVFHRYVRNQHHLLPLSLNYTKTHKGSFLLRIRMRIRYLS